jgi:uncharacterized protein (DUF983 family)
MASRTTSPSRVRMLWRGSTRRCPRCGTGKLFRRWFTMVPDCPGCGLHFEREPGYWVGAVAINTMIIGMVFAIIMITVSAATIPDIPWVALLMAELPLMVLGPLFVYPFSKTIWVGINLAFFRNYK